jgi:cysteine desulfurase
VNAGRIYLDHNASSPLRPEAREALASALADPFLNPSSVHAAGRRARRAIDEAREQVAALLGADPTEILFTSGGTEANHLAWNSFRRAGVRLATTAVEHPSLREAAAAARSAGADLTDLGVTRDGSLRPDDVDRLAERPPAFLSVQVANSETGALLPVGRLAGRFRALGAVVHTDAVQAVGRIGVDLAGLPVDLLSMSGHKLGAPTGVGALYVRRGTAVEALWNGGPQEKGRRPGTENVTGIAALGAVCRALAAGAEAERERIRRLRDLFERELLGRIEGMRVTAAESERLPNTSHLQFDGVDGESLLLACDLEGLEASMGSACSSGSLRPSPVLTAMGFTEAEARGSLRFSFGWSTSEEDVERAAALLPKLVAQVRKAGQNYTFRKGL